MQRGTNLDDGAGLAGKCLQNGLEKRHFRACMTARRRTGQLRHRGKRFALQFGLKLAFVDRLVLVRC
jgi:hypothetical protein